MPVGGFQDVRGCGGEAMSNDSRHGPTVSVVMTVYNPHPTFFRTAVRSILDQSWQDFEFIIVEDPSPRRGDEMLRGINDPRLRYIANMTRTSLVAQKNRGLATASGRYIALMDADDKAHPSRLAKQVRYLRARPEISVLGSQIDVIDADDRSVGHRRFPLEHDAIFKALPRVVPLSQPSVMFRREAFLSFGGYQFTEYSTAEDYDLWSRWIKQGVRFANHPEPLLSYRLHPDQTKFTKLRETILGDLRVKQIHWSKQMDARSRLWRYAQTMLLYLPEKVVAKLLVSLLYRDRLVATAIGDPGVARNQPLLGDVVLVESELGVAPHECEDHPLTGRQPN
jgi:glycosyltransferase involved in cell wall biosynthesis